MKTICTVICLTVWGSLTEIDTSEAAIVRIDNRADWEYAAGGSPDFEVDFNNYSEDTSFYQTTVDVGPFSLEGNGDSSTESRDKIDVPPLHRTEMNIDGTALVLILLENDRLVPYDVSMTFDVPLTAWGADFSGMNGYEATELVFHTASGPQTLSLGRDLRGVHFHGFVTPTDDPFSAITFKGGGNGQSTTGTEATLDNIAGMHVPEPSSLVLLTAAAMILLLARRRRSSM